MQDLLLPFLQIVFTCFDTALFFYNIVNSARIHLIFTSVETVGRRLLVELVLPLGLDASDVMERYTICVVLLLRILGDTRALFRKRVTSLLQC